MFYQIYAESKVDLFLTELKKINPNATKADISIKGAKRIHAKIQDKKAEWDGGKADKIPYNKPY